VDYGQQCEINSGRGDNIVNNCQGYASEETKCSGNGRTGNIKRLNLLNEIDSNRLKKPAFQYKPKLHKAQ
jgi:hypothetical protein